MTNIQYKILEKTYSRMWPSLRCALHQCSQENQQTILETGLKMHLARTHRSLSVSDEDIRTFIRETIDSIA